WEITGHYRGAELSYVVWVSKGIRVIRVTENSAALFAPTNRSMDMPDVPNQRLLEALLDSWDRNNTILVNLLRALPNRGLEARVMESSPSVTEMFTHIHYVRLVFVSEDAPEFARDLPEEEWRGEGDSERSH